MPTHEALLARPPSSWTREDLIVLLNPEQAEQSRALRALAQACKHRVVGNKVYFRGLIEYSNRCMKNCFYCGIRRDNLRVQRYELGEEEVLEAARLAAEYRYASLVLQGGERDDRAFVDRMTHLLRRIHQETGGILGITLSLGEQTEETYRTWMEAGASRYLLRIETSNRELYGKIHPSDHDFDKRLACIRTLKRLGYQTGTGVMIGLPGQTVADLADDLLFFRREDIDMVGMGPFIGHEDTPLWEEESRLPDRRWRFELTLNMLSLLRLLMPDINIAATTAMQAIDPEGREKALVAGANVIMPNLTPTRYRTGYQLYADKPCLDEEAGQCRLCLEQRIRSVGEEIGYDVWGNSLHHRRRMEEAGEETPSREGGS